MSVTVGEGREGFDEVEMLAVGTDEGRTADSSDAMSVTFDDASISLELVGMALTKEYCHDLTPFPL